MVGNAGTGNAGFQPASATASAAACGQDARVPDEANVPRHKGWYSRGYLPHLDVPKTIQFVTFRLHDSVPLSIIEQWKDELKLSPALLASNPLVIKLYHRIATYEDVGHGACWMRDPDIAALVQDALLHFDGRRYRLLEWCVMPNHAHALVETLEGYSLTAIVHSWKSFTANAANQTLKRKGAFWMPDFFDRFIRNEEHLQQTREYIRNNPVKAGLCQSADAYPFGSAVGNTGFQPAPSTSTIASCGQDAWVPEKQINYLQGK